MQKEKHMPLLGVGPIYVVCCILLTICGITFAKMGFLDIGQVEHFNLVFYVFGTFFIILGIMLWLFAVVFSRIDEKIKSGRLAKDGVYGIVRNPIYSAFLFICTGVLLFLHNLFLLLLPPLFWLFLTIFMIFTEERWLKKEFGAEYDEYCRHVNRVIPFFRISKCKKKSKTDEIEVKSGH